MLLDAAEKTVGLNETTHTEAVETFAAPKKLSLGHVGQNLASLIR